jgi:hypothetical protein
LLIVHPHLFSITPSGLYPVHFTLARRAAPEYRCFESPEKKQNDRVMKLKIFSIALALASIGAPALAQMSPMGAGGGGFDLAPFFGDNKSFSATAEVKTRLPNQEKAMTIPMKFATLDGRIRSEVDVTEIKDAPFPPSAIPMMKQMGMDRTITISMPEKSSVMIIYPGLKAYAEMTVPGAKATDPSKKPKIEKTGAGKESIDGHDCEKNKVVVTGEDGQAHEALVWNAADLKGFPVQIELTSGGATSTTKFSNVSVEKPDAKLFEAPPEFIKYDGVQQLMQAVMMKKAATLQARPNTGP